ncbi:unnamed protein product [Timema podura]|uniref:Uncharacterized protein n=1 Tax=Timema podura TaxID=61482 RepID=A0ABN7NYH5_TIMPD|nr:unnamed protein product [Timema podura]
MFQRLRGGRLGNYLGITSNSTPQQVFKSPNSLNIDSNPDIFRQVLHALFSDQNGTTVSEQGRLTLTNEGWESVIVKEGSYSYVSPEGIPVSVSYIADEKGFRATGSHLPNVVLVKGR